jgi:hypothetical protein
MWGFNNKSRNHTNTLTNPNEEKKWMIIILYLESMWVFYESLKWILQMTWNKFLSNTYIFKVGYMCVNIENRYRSLPISGAPALHITHTHTHTHFCWSLLCGHKQMMENGNLSQMDLTCALKLQGTFISLFTFKTM